jgi:F-type H+-transporting ATPase subunit epsilon
MARLSVDIVTPERRLAQVQADEVIAPGADGLFGVRPGHAPFLSLLQAGPLTVREGTTTTRYFVSGGFAEVGTGTVRVLADAAELSSGIDTQASTKRIASAEEALKGLEVTDPKATAQRAIITLEKKRLEVAALK